MIFSAAIIFLIICLFSVLSIVFWSIRNGITPTPSTSTAKAQMLELLNEIPDPLQGNVYELGAGWGTLAFVLAKALPHHQVIAIENSPIPYAFCRLRLLLFPLPNLVFKKSDFFTVSLQDASLIFCYLYPGAMVKLKDKLDKELTHPLWVVSNTFALPDTPPFKKKTLNDLYRTNIYLFCYNEFKQERDL